MGDNPLNQTNIAYMEETIIENINSTNNEPALEAPEETVDVAQLQETNKKLFERAKKAEESLKVFKKATITTPKEADPDIVSRLSKIEQVESKRQFGFENSLSPEETDYVFTFTNGKPTKEALENPFVKAGLDGYRQSKRVSDNTPSSSARGFQATGKDFKDLSEDERRSAFESDMKKRRG